MISSEHTVLIFFLITYLGNVWSDDATILNCIDKILTDFDFGQTKLQCQRENLSIRAFLKKAEYDYQTEEGKEYARHMRDEMFPTKDMELPRQFCHSQTTVQTEFTTCYNLLKSSKFLPLDDKTKFLRDVFWNLKETDFINKKPDGTILKEGDRIIINRDGTTRYYDYMFNNPDGTVNYRYKYFYYLSQNFIFTHIERDFPFTPREFCKTRKRASATKNASELLNEKGEGSVSSKTKTIIRVNRTQDLIS